MTIISGYGQSSLIKQKVRQESVKEDEKLKEEKIVEDVKKSKATVKYVAPNRSQSTEQPPKAGACTYGAGAASASDVSDPSSSERTEQIKKQVADLTETAMQSLLQAVSDEASDNFDKAKKEGKTGKDLYGFAKGTRNVSVSLGKPLFEKTQSFTVVLCGAAIVQIDPNSGWLKTTRKRDYILPEYIK